MSSHNVFGRHLIILAFSGLANLFCWLCLIHLPQAIENHKTGSAAALSPQMLGLWVLGDIAGIFGLLLNKTFGTPFVTQLYYFLMDFVLVLQFVYFRKYPRNKANNESSEHLIDGDNLDDLQFSQ
eukprot:UN09917